MQKLSLAITSIGFLTFLFGGCCTAKKEDDWWIPLVISAVGILILVIGAIGLSKFADDEYKEVLNLIEDDEEFYDENSEITPLLTPITDFELTYLVAKEIGTAKENGNGI